METDLHALALPVRLRTERPLTGMKRRVVEIYRPGQVPEIVEGVSTVYGESPVAGFALEFARIWQ